MFSIEDRSGRLWDWFYESADGQIFTGPDHLRLFDDLASEQLYFYTSGMEVSPLSAFRQEKMDSTLLEDRILTCEFEWMGAGSGVLLTKERRFQMSSLMICIFSWKLGEVPSRQVRFVTSFLLNQRLPCFLGVIITRSVVGEQPVFATPDKRKFSMTMDPFLMGALRPLQRIATMYSSLAETRLLPTCLKFIPLESCLIFSSKVAKVASPLTSSFSSWPALPLSILAVTACTSDLTISLSLTFGAMLKPKLLLKNSSFHHTRTSPWQSIPTMPACTMKGNLTRCSSSLKPLQAPSSTQSASSVVSVTCSALSLHGTQSVTTETSMAALPILQVICQSLILLTTTTLPEQLSFLLRQQLTSVWKLEVSRGMASQTWTSPLLSESQQTVGRPGSESLVRSFLQLVMINIIA